MIAVEEMIEQLSVLISEYEEFCSVFPPYWGYGISGSPVSQSQEGMEIREEFLLRSYRFKAAIHPFTTPGDSYQKNLDDVSSDVALADSLLPIAKALRADLQDGRFRSVSEFIHADMFSDFLEIARELHESDCKDTAAVQADTALESHLRLLAPKHNIKTVTEKIDPKVPET